MKAVKKNYPKTGKLSDEVVVEHILEGEKELFEILMRRYNQTLYRTIRSYLHTEKDIEDAMQETYLKAFQKLCQFKNEAAFSTWLIQIGINEALQHLRKGKKKRTANSGLNDNIIYSSDIRKVNPEKKAIQNETRLLIEQAVDKLPEKYRIVYVLREVEGLDNSSIANCLKLSESNVKVRFHRSKKMLKESLYELSSDAELFEFGDARCDKMVNTVMNNLG